ncbi:MAG TPA: glycosyltransferase family 1 protein [Kofleriaceae bacterium]|nr:glycosyltransferase family 1 protein [Kofleriaceae bacterium]
MIARHITAGHAAGPRVVVISDTVDDINGVALGLRRLVAAANRAGHRMSLVGPAATRPIVDDVVRIASAMSAALPFYPDMTWSVPELPGLVSYLASHADLVQVATPGPMGIAGLIAGRMLGLPVIAQYHTEVAEYAARMTGLAMLRGLVEPLVGWFYQQADLCLAPSDAVERRLAAIGVAPERICRVQRGVDLELFDPRRRDPGALARYGITGPTALYVGRLSKEKNLDALVAAWATVHAARPDARLLVVGEGPLAGSLRGDGIVCTGPLYDHELATVFASADVFAFASETETFGNVVVEAAASGVPAVVATVGASREHVLDGVTGRVVDASSPAFARAILELLGDRARRDEMAGAARLHAASYELTRAVRSTWAIYDRVLHPRPLEAAS